MVERRKVERTGKMGARKGVERNEVGSYGVGRNEGWKMGERKAEREKAGKGLAERERKLVLGVQKIVRRILEGLKRTS